MNNIEYPIIRRIADTKTALDVFENEMLNGEYEKINRIIRDFPTVYIHNWNDQNNYEVYVGESNNVFQRTRQHFDLASDKTRWQSNLSKKNAELYIIGHEHFNKSLTLDVENRLIHYLMSVDSVRKVHNYRGNPQKDYYPVEEFDGIFTKVWECLRSYNSELFPAESVVRDSAIFKASPLHKLTDEQEQAKNQIIKTVRNALAKKKTKQLIFIDGEAGTGKTVLNSSAFYELCSGSNGLHHGIRCWMLVNHDEQITVYKQIADKLGITDKYGNLVSKPTSFINNHTEKNPVDVVFVDEAHLLLTQGKQSYQGENQLQDIIDRARVTVVMFDENQVLSTEQYWEAQILDKYRQEAIGNSCHIVLDKQLRMNVDPETLDWIDSFTKKSIVKRIPKDSNGYSIRIFDSPDDLCAQIEDKAKNDETSLSRLIATYDWEYSSNNKPKDHLRKYWEVMIGDWHRPWNRELEQELTRAQKKMNSGLAWAEQPQTINEVGSTFTIQGFDLNYAGVILGHSVKYRNGRIIYDPSSSCDNKAVRNRTLSDGSKQKFGELLIQHEVRVLMTRGVNGLYI